jgi:hypothetical protein
MYQQKHTKATTAAVSERKVASRSSSKPSDSFNCMKSGCWGWFGASSLDLLNDLSELQNLKTANGNSLWKKRGLANGRLQPQSDKSRVHHLFLSHHWKRQVVRNDNLHSAGVASWLLSIYDALPPYDRGSKVLTSKISWSMTTQYWKQTYLTICESIGVSYLHRILRPQSPVVCKTYNK